MPLQLQELRALSLLLRQIVELLDDAILITESAKDVALTGKLKAFGFRLKDEHAAVQTRIAKFSD